MQQIINTLVWALSSIPGFIKKWWVPLSILLGIIADPTGAAGHFICLTLDFILSPLPATPNALKISSLVAGMASALGQSFPLIGQGIFNEVFSGMAIAFGLLVGIKIYKLIPFKAT